MSGEVHWTALDFAVAALLLFGGGALCEMALTRSRDPAGKAGAALAAATGVLLLWVNGAVGIAGSSDEPYNLVYVCIVAAALGGSLLTGLRATGMMWSMALTAVAQMAVAAVALGWGLGDSHKIVAFTVIFTSMWAASACLFAWAARAPERDVRDAL